MSQSQSRGHRISIPLYVISSLASAAAGTPILTVAPAAIMPHVHWHTPTPRVAALRRRPSSSPDAVDTRDADINSEALL